MVRAIVVGLLLFIAFAIWQAPASLLRTAVSGVEGVELIETRGTLWAGQGTLIIGSERLGNVQWDVEPSALLSLSLAYQLVLEGPVANSSGRVALSFSGLDGQLDGTLNNALLQRVLNPYDVNLPGDIQFTGVQFVMQRSGSLENLQGDLRWPGGQVVYPEGAGLRRAVLPPLVAVLGHDAGVGTADVFPQGEETPLLRARTAPNGFLKIGVTKLLTKLVGRPWRGSDPDHAIVLELEEQFL